MPLNTLEHRITLMFNTGGGGEVVLVIVAYTCYKRLTFTVLHISTLNLLIVRKTYMTGENSDELLENAYE